MVRGPMIAGGRADGADLALPDEVGQRTEGFVDVDGGVGAVHLVEVDPVGVQASQRVLDGVDDPTPRARRG
jgi:hypothetical protein